MERLNHMELTGKIKIPAGNFQVMSKFIRKSVKGHNCNQNSPLLSKVLKRVFRVLNLLLINPNLQCYNLLDLLKRLFKHYFQTIDLDFEKKEFWSVYFDYVPLKNTSIYIIFERIHHLHPNLHICYLNVKYFV